GATVARKVDAAIYREGRHACGVVYTFWRDVENAGNRWYYRPKVSVGAIPTNGGDTLVFAATPPARFQHEIRADMGAGHRQVLEECAPALARELADAEPSEPFRGFPGHPGVMRQSHGPGW